MCVSVCPRLIVQKENRLSGLSIFPLPKKGKTFFPYLFLLLLRVVGSDSISQKDPDRPMASSSISSFLLSL